jgi:hypothetical protein
MHPTQELFDRGPILGDAENLLRARIPGENAPERIILPRPELGCLEAKL